MTARPKLLERAAAPEVARASMMVHTLEALEVNELVDEYLEMKEVAPRRGEDGFRYFVERSGRPAQDVDERRGEERLAMALVNDQASLSVAGENVEMIMYAFPLYTRGGPHGIRGIDLVGHADGPRRFWVVELKVAAKTGYGETPLRALYEALVYGAVVEANQAVIASELSEQARRMEHLRPGLLIAAPDEYWERWAPNERIGDWWTHYCSIATALSKQLETPLETVSLGRIHYEIDAKGRPRIAGRLDGRPVDYP